MTSADGAATPTGASAAPPVPPAPVLVAGVDVDALAAGVLACPAVAGLSGGLLGSAGTYLPGRRVTGVVVREGDGGGAPDVEVHVVAVYGPSMATVAEQVHAVVAAHAPGARVSVQIDDVDLPAGP